MNTKKFYLLIAFFIFSLTINIHSANSQAAEPTTYSESLRELQSIFLGMGTFTGYSRHSFGIRTSETSISIEEAETCCIDINVKVKRIDHHGNHVNYKGFVKTVNLKNDSFESIYINKPNKITLYDDNYSISIAMKKADWYGGGWNIQKIFLNTSTNKNTRDRIIYLFKSLENNCRY